MGDLDGALEMGAIEGVSVPPGGVGANEGRKVGLSVG